MKRHELKALIKECLIEILADGLGESIQESRTVQRRQAPPAGIRQIMGGQQQRRVDPRLDSRPAYNNQIQQAINEVTRDPIMASIFADTANTTLQNQNANGHAREGGAPQGGMMMGDHAQRLAAAAEPAQMFGEETVDRWSKLADAAFGPKRPTLAVASQPMATHHRAPPMASPMLDWDPYAPNPEIKPA